jgi:hypothetical protein
MRESNNGEREREKEERARATETCNQHENEDELSSCFVIAWTLCSITSYL